jgi:2-keto-4-pentenoate hydratase
MSALASAATDAETLRKIADEAFAAFNSGGRHVPSFSARYPSFTQDDAYRVTALPNGMRVAKGYRPHGRKIGFTNRRLWDEYGVRAPIWGYVYDRTMHDLAVPLLLAPYTDPKIEPEIARRCPLARHGRRRAAVMHHMGLARCRDCTIHLPGLEILAARHRYRRRHARRAAGRGHGTTSARMQRSGCARSQNSRSSSIATDS